MRIDQLARCCVEMAKMWRSDKYLRNLQASLVAVDKDITLLIDGSGNIIEPNQGIIGEDG